MGTKAMLQEWGLDSTVALKTDSAAALGLNQRRGVGRVRHVATRHLWLQEKVAKKEIHISKVATKANRVDLLTKPLPEPRIRELMGTLGYAYREGRADSQRGLC